MSPPSVATFLYTLQLFRSYNLVVTCIKLLSTEKLSLYGLYGDIGKFTTATETATTTASLSTTSENKKQEDVEVQKNSSEMDSDPGTPTLKRQGTLRRKKTIHRGKQKGMTAITKNN